MLCYYKSHRKRGSVGEITCSPRNNGEHAAASAALVYRNHLWAMPFIWTGI